MARLMGAPILALLAASVALAGCTSAAPAPAPSTSAAHEKALLLVAIGDSIPYNLNEDCPGCTGFVESVAAELKSASGRPVTVENRSRHDGARSQDIADQLQQDDELIGLLRKADVVIASFGFNDQPPYVTGSGLCPLVSDDDPEDVAFTAAAKTTRPCVDAQTATLRQTARGLLKRMTSLAPNAAIGVLDSYDAWKGWDLLDQQYTAIKAPLLVTIRYALVRWNDALCAEARAAKVTCVDIYHRINGKDGRAPAGDQLAEDHTHPSQKGNDTIADEVGKSGLLTTVGR